MNTNLSRRQFFGSSAAVAAAVGFSGVAAVARAQTPAASTKPYRFRYGLNAGTIRGYKLGFVEQVEVAGKAGYEGIEPWMSDVEKFVQGGGSLKDMGKHCKDLGLAVYGGIGFASWIVDDEQQRAKGVERLKQEMDWLAQLGGTHIAAPPAGATKQGMKLEPARMAERYRAILELGRQSGVIPQLEIWGASANLSTLNEALDVAARAGHPDACILADVYHLYKGGTEPAALRLLSRQVTHCFHMNDYPATPERAVITDAARVWPSDGIAPLKQILNILADNHCNAMLSLELFNAEYWKQPVAATAATGLAKMKASVAAAGLA
jgi:sugar phosphate isomerase/epimerase